MLLSQAHAAFHHLVEWGVLILEFFGTSVLIVTGVISMVKWLKRAPDVRTTISQGILLALAFKMGGEVLRTVIITEPIEMFTIFGIIILRGIVAGLIYWEITKEIKIESLYHSSGLSESPHKKAQAPPSGDGTEAQT